MITAFANEWGKVRKRETNSEQALIFPACILRKAKGASRAKATRRRILRWPDLWEKGKIAELVKNIFNSARQGEGKGKCVEDDDSIARKFHSMMIEGKVRQAVPWVTNRDDGGVLHPDDVDTKIGKTVVEVLESKHPSCMIPQLGKEGWASFEDYDEQLNSVLVYYDQEIVQNVADKMQGGAGPSTVDAQAMSSWRLKFGKNSHLLREEMASWVEWLGKDSPP